MTSGSPHPHCARLRRRHAGRSAKTLEPVVREQIATDKAASESQSRVNELSEETRSALLQYRQHLEEARSLGDYARQLETQVQSQEEELAFTQKQLVEIETTTREVLPLMEKMLATLDRFVALDVPFQLDERRKRVDTLKQMMGRADVTVSEKYRRIIEAYQIETDYGRTLEAYQGELGLGGDARTVRFLRAGRVAALPDARRPGDGLLGRAAEEVGGRRLLPGRREEGLRGRRQGRRAGPADRARAGARGERIMSARSFLARFALAACLALGAHAHAAETLDELLRRRATRAPRRRRRTRRASRSSWPIATVRSSSCRTRSASATPRRRGASSSPRASTPTRSS
jgi:hypothetical protein